MIDRTQLTEAADPPTYHPGDITVEVYDVLLQAAQWALDFPTDQQIIAATDAVDPFLVHPLEAHDAAVAVLEAVRDTMIGDNNER